MPPTHIRSINCPSLSHLTPTQLVSMLTRWGCSEKNKNNMGRYINPIWLKNKGQNVVGIFPQKAFYLLPPPNINQQAHATQKINSNQQNSVQQSINTLNSQANNQSTELQLLTLTRKSLLSFSPPTLSSFPDTENNDSTIISPAGEMQLNLTNIANIDRFVGQLISYGESIEPVVKKAIENSSDSDINNVNASFDKSLEKNATENSHDDINNYTDGLMGFIGYDVMANNFVHKVHKTPNQQSQFTLEYLQQGQPATYLGHYPIYLTCDTKSHQHRWQLHATTTETHAILASIQAWLTSVVKDFRPLIVRPASIKLTAKWSFANYQFAFDETQDYLTAGDCYQVNLTQVWKGNLINNNKLVSYLPKLDTYTTAPFAGYLFTQNPKNQQDFELLSCSPELFFTFQKSQQDGSINITTKPIKGTRPRGDSAEQDNELKKELANSKKDLAENVMIVDLLRNDLGKYAKTGTVKVPKRFVIESFSNVHHLVSTVTATLKDNIHPMEALFGSLPAGSITGTPKKRAIEIINELESEPRGAYCGTMGYMNFDGSGQWNVLIRTLQANQQSVSLWAGGGITVASECVDEHEECLDKVNNILNVLSNM